MPKSYVEAGCSNNNVKGKSISFCIFANRVKKKARWGKWVPAMRRVNADGSPWYPWGIYAYIFLERFVTG